MYSGFVILAQAAGEGAPPGPPPLAQFLPIMIIMLLFVFMMILPMRKQKREQAAMMASLKKNDEVLTQAGIYGVVVSIKDTEDEITLRTDDGTNSRVRVMKSSVVRVIKSSPATTEQKTT